MTGIPASTRRASAHAAPDAGELDVGELDVDELFDAIEDLAALDRPLPMPLGRLLSNLVTAWDRASGTGPLDELTAAAADVVQEPRERVPDDVTAALDRLAAAVTTARRVTAPGPPDAARDALHGSRGLRSNQTASHVKEPGGLVLP
ncbi:hypothetical protein [Actinomadura sp. 21ATH]|uniref:hypothetical protein n=1 Tax=Actinomadura sp. 21ATH TaxID=1735444 RepID=UPI0035BEDE88